jgi:transposase InsO family protein
MVGLLRQVLGGFTHLLVVVDKFSKWIEAQPIVNVRSEEAVSFFADNIYRFGIPNMIITDNGTQFTGKEFLNFCDDNNIRVDWSAVAHPMMNGQVERANSMILQGLKPLIFKRLEKFRARWVAELPSGACAPHCVGRRVSRSSSWCTAWKRSYLRTSTTAAYEYEPTPRKATGARLRM